MPDSLATPVIFRLSPLIQITLINLYLALTLPLVVLARVTQTDSSLGWLGFALILGLMALIAALSERVILDPTGIQVSYPAWVPSFFRQGWVLAWSDIAELKSRTTGQGGLVYYFVTAQRDRAYLLPLRIVGFARLTRIVQEQTGCDTTDIRPLAQPWMYFLLFGFTLVLWLMEAFMLWWSHH